MDTIEVIIHQQSYSELIYMSHDCYLARALRNMGYEDVRV